MQINAEIQTTCCIAGGGPAGMMVGLLLARAGIDTVVLEKHADFLRDFRGDTVHPSTLELMHELGFLEAFLERPHQEVAELKGVVGDIPVTIADFSHLAVACPFIALMPQWNFLDFLADRAREYANFRLLMETEVSDLLWAGDGVAGVRAETKDGPLEIRATLTIGADGRSSVVRERAGMHVENLGAPIDVFWMRLPRKSGEDQAALGRVGAGHFFVMIDRGSYWQCAYVIPKGTADDIRARGLEAFRRDIATIAPELEDRVTELQDWNDIKLLTVKVDRLAQWYKPGLLVIGDAAHAMSPIGGVGINLAIQDAVATANILVDPLYENRLGTADLAKVQKRRNFPTRMTQSLQVFLQNRVLTRVLNLRRKPRPPWPLKLAQKIPVLRRIPARLIGVGFRPEHVHSARRQPATKKGASESR